MVTLEKKKIYIFLRFSNLQNKDVHQFLFNDIKILNIKILKLNAIIFPVDIHSSNSAFRDYVLNYPCAPCRRFKLPFKVPVSYHSWTRVEPSPGTSTKTKGLRLFPSHPIHGDMHVYLLHTTSSHSLLVLSSPYCELFTLAWHRLQHDVDVELNAAPWFPSFLLLPRRKTRDYSLRAALSFVHAWKSSPLLLLLASSLPGTRFIFPSRLLLDSWGSLSCPLSSSRRENFYAKEIAKCAAERCQSLLKRNTI